jgi:hypothetical protein
MMRIIELLKVLVSGCRAYLSCFETYGTRPSVATAAGRDRTPRETVSATITRNQLDGLDIV